MMGDTLIHPRMLMPNCIFDPNERAHDALYEATRYRRVARPSHQGGRVPQEQEAIPFALVARRSSADHAARHMFGAGLLTTPTTRPQVSHASLSLNPAHSSPRPWIPSPPATAGSQLLYFQPRYFHFTSGAQFPRRSFSNSADNKKILPFSRNPALTNLSALLNQTPK